MSEPFETLLFDAGNTRLKWAVLEGDELHSHGAFAYHSKENDLGLTEVLSALQCVPAKIACGSVATQTVNQVLSEICQKHYGLPLRLITSSAEISGLKLAYQEPHKLGVDRSLAMRGAIGIHSGPLCVADCGTALTLDCVDGSGQHFGGMIAPGYALMKKSLLSNTARIDEADEIVPTSPFGDDTGFAVNAGCSFALAALADRFVIEASAQFGEEPLLIVTGGGRERLLELLIHDAVECPDLVLRGLAAVVQDAR